MVSVTDVGDDQKDKNGSRLTKRRETGRLVVQEVSVVSIPIST